MTNKTFKEEVIERFNKQFTYEDCDCYDWFCENKDMNNFLIETLDLYKQKILEALPKEKQSWKTEKNFVYDEEEEGFNSCLSEVKQIIENI